MDEMFSPALFLEQPTSGSLEKIIATQLEGVEFNKGSIISESSGHILEYLKKKVITNYTLTT